MDKHMGDTEGTDICQIWMKTSSKNTFCQKKMKLDMIFRIFMVSYKRALYEYKEWG